MATTAEPQVIQEVECKYDDCLTVVSLTADDAVTARTYQTECRCGATIEWTDDGS